MDFSAAKMIGAGLATIGLIGAGFGLGNIFSSLLESIARNPSAEKDLRKASFLGFALTESVALLAFVIAMLILYSKAPEATTATPVTAMAQASSVETTK